MMFWPMLWNILFVSLVKLGKCWSSGMVLFLNFSSINFFKILQELKKIWDLICKKLTADSLFWYRESMKMSIICTKSFSGLENPVTLTKIPCSIGSSSKKHFSMLLILGNKGGTKVRENESGYYLGSLNLQK